MNKIYTIITVVILMAISFGAGYWLYSYNSFGEEIIPGRQETLTDLTTSPLVQSWTATLFGQIFSISEESIILSFADESLEVIIADNAQLSRVSFIVPATEGGAITDFETEDIQFDDLSEGQNVNIVAQINKGGELEAINVTVLEGSDLE